MGNTLGLKITKIGECNILKDVVFSQDKKVLPYLHYIVKINKFYVENFIKGSVIREFTIKDVIRDKDFTIAIERMESGLFFEGLSYLLEQVPKLERVLFISNVLYDSPSNIRGVRAGQTILLGNEKRYFDCLENVEEEITSSNAKFIFYDFLEEKVYFIDFEEFRQGSSELKMGFECEVRLLKEIFNSNGRVILKEKTNNNCDLLNLNSNPSIIPHVKNINECKNIFHESQNQTLIVCDDKLLQPKNSNICLLDKHIPCEENILDGKELKQEDPYNKILYNEKNEPVASNQLEIDTNQIENQFQSKKISSSNLIIGENKISPINNIEINLSKTNFDKHLLNKTINPEILEEKILLKTISINQKDEKIDLKSPQKEVEEIIHTSKLENILHNTTQILSTTNNQLINNEYTSIENKVLSPTICNQSDSIPKTTGALGNLQVARNKHYKYTLDKGKNKYNKFLSIYEKIDSNFNFMNINKKISHKSETENESVNEEINLSQFEKECSSIIMQMPSEYLENSNEKEKNIFDPITCNIKFDGEELQLLDSENDTYIKNNINNSPGTIYPSSSSHAPSRPSLNKNSRVILIKGFYLANSDLRIQNLSDNTTNYYCIKNI